MFSAVSACAPVQPAGDVDTVPFPAAPPAEPESEIDHFIQDKENTATPGPPRSAKNLRDNPFASSAKLKAAAKFKERAVAEAAAANAKTSMASPLRPTNIGMSMEKAFDGDGKENQALSGTPVFNPDSFLSSTKKLQADADGVDEEDD